MLIKIAIFTAGLFAGWWFLPQPEWAKRLKTKLFG
jgi:hypothetical protein